MRGWGLRTRLQNYRVDHRLRAGRPLTEVDMNAVKYLKTIGMPMKDIMSVSHQMLCNEIQVSGNPSDYATITATYHDI